MEAIPYKKYPEILSQSSKKSAQNKLFFPPKVPEMFAQCTLNVLRKMELLDLLFILTGALKCHKFISDLYKCASIFA